MLVLLVGALAIIPQCKPQVCSDVINMAEAALEVCQSSSKKPCQWESYRDQKEYFIVVTCLA